MRPSSASPWVLVVTSIGASVVSAEDLAVRRTFAGHPAKILDGGLSPDGSWGATVDEQGTVKFWSAAEGNELAEAQLEVDAQVGSDAELEDLPQRLIVRPSGEGEVAVAQLGGTLTLLDPRDGRILWSVELNGPLYRDAIFFAPSGETLWAFLGSKLVELDAATGMTLRELETPDGVRVALSADAAQMAIAASFPNTGVSILNLSDGSLLHRFEAKEAEALGYTPGGKHLVMNVNSQDMIYDVLTWTEVGKVPGLLGERAAAQGYAFASDGGTLFASRLVLDVVDVTTWTLRDSLGLTGAFRFIGGEVMVAGALSDSPELTLHRWDPSTGAHTQSLTLPDSLSPLGFVEEGLVTGVNSSAHPYRVLDVDAGNFVSGFQDEDEELGYPFDAFVPETPEKMVLGISRDASQPPVVYQWGLANGSLIRSTKAHAFSIDGLVVSLDGSLFATWGSDGEGEANTARVWRVEDASLQAEVSDVEDRITALAFSPDAKLLAVGDGAGAVRAWSTLDARLDREFAAPLADQSGLPAKTGSALAFSADGQRLASAGVNWDIADGHSGRITIWSVADGSEVGDLLSLGEANLRRLEFSPDGRFLVAPFYSTRVWCLDELEK